MSRKRPLKILENFALIFSWSRLSIPPFPSDLTVTGKVIIPKFSEMVKIRLRREGTKDRPYYRIIVADSRARREGAFIEQVGTYDPLKKGDTFQIDLAKVDEWVGKGAQPTETVSSMIKKARKSAA